MKNTLISTIFPTIKKIDSIDKEKFDAIVYIVDDSSFKNTEYKEIINEALDHSCKDIKEDEVLFIGKKDKAFQIVAYIKEYTISKKLALGAKIACHLKAKKEIENVLIKNLSKEISFDILRGLFDKLYTFKKYITKEESLKKLSNISRVLILDSKLEEAFIKSLENEMKSLYMIRDLVNEPANCINPETMADFAKSEIDVKNLKVKVLGAKDLEKLGMHMMLGVGLGSDKETKMVVAEYKGDESKKDWDIALIGKGVTFDCGGLSIKPADSMEGMKGDMAGAATVLGIANYLANEKKKVNLIAAVGLVENMINGSAQRPGDIVKSMSGLTVEVLNTDAEGRLVLGDVLYYVKKTYEPAVMIDFATLTGAITVALGTERAGIFSNNEKLATAVFESGENVNNKCWKMPLDEYHVDAMKSNIADLRNISKKGSGGGSSTAAAFLSQFIDGHKNWLHMDIANVSDYEFEHKLYGHGASGFGLRLVSDLIDSGLKPFLKSKK